MGPARPLQGCRVLVVEDEYFIPDDLDRALSAQGAEVVGPIGNLDAAMRQVERDGFEVAVLDINLRDKKVYPVADELRRRHLPFVFATGYDAGAVPGRFADVPRWEKPYDLASLIRDIEHLCPRLGYSREPSERSPP